MEAEALPVIAGLGLARDDPPAIPPPAPALSWSGTVKGTAAGSENHALAVTVVCPGKCRKHGVDNIGTVPAAVTAYLAVQALTPDLIISAGTAGGFSARGALVGDVFLATGFANHDRRIPLETFDAYGVWATDAHPAPRLAASAGLKSGVVTTGNSLDATDADLLAMAANGAAVKEMEAAGAVWAAHLFDTPMLALKSVTDIVDGDRPAAEEFLANLSTATTALHVSWVCGFGERRELSLLEKRAPSRLSQHTHTLSLSLSSHRTS
jgi:5'-methylthioadenosine nucleosidase